ncbi:TetR/AcrR family transcriptional regulator [Cellulomonas sp. FA1]|uniref:TetR/AcrR family transcriptional regulator n=1 Tax=Cellulomonas sp. FA1 TaxID=1346710 RepID=UPI000626052B|nr:TetR/AcrR family transcriptional regulator [Cellulomonas sp. FA1]
MARRPTRQAILDAAITVAARRGITGASMDEVAEEAQVAKGSLYYNFDSKDALFSEVLRTGFTRLVDTVSAARTGLTGRAALRSVAVATMTLLQTNPELAKLMAAELFRTDRTWGDALAPIRSDVAVHFRDVLREVRAEQGADPTTVTGISGAALLGALAVASLDWLLFHPDLDVQVAVDEVLVTVGA